MTDNLHQQLVRPYSVGDFSILDEYERELESLHMLEACVPIEFRGKVLQQIRNLEILIEKQIEHLKKGMGISLRWGMRG